MINPETFLAALQKRVTLLEEGLFVPANDQSPLPTLNHKPIPITNAAQHARITEAWLANRHRAAENKIT